MPAPAAPLTPEVPELDAVAEVAKTLELPIFQVVVTLPPSPPAPLVPDSSAFSAVLERALTELCQLREDLQGAKSHLVAGRLEMVSG